MSSSEFTLSNFLISGFYGALRGIVGMPLEHPLDCIKTRWQSQLNFSNPFSVARNIYSKNGILGFYAGAIPNSLRIASKQLYRWPLMLYLPVAFRKFLQSRGKEPNSTFVKTLTGLVIAVFEVFFICPMERLKVWLMTQIKKQHNIRFFFRNASGRLLGELFRGVQASLTKQIVSWVTFLSADDFCKRKMRQYKQCETLSYSQLMMVSVCVMLANTAAVMPLDCIKTRYQMDKGTQHESMRSVALSIYRQHGVRGLYAGYQVKMVQYFIQSLMTVNLLEYFEKKLRA